MTTKKMTCRKHGQVLAVKTGNPLMRGAGALFTLGVSTGLKGWACPICGERCERKMTTDLSAMAMRASVRASGAKGPKCRHGVNPDICAMCGNTEKVKGAR